MYIQIFLVFSLEHGDNSSLKFVCKCCGRKWNWYFCNKAILCSIEERNRNASSGFLLITFHWCLAKLCSLFWKGAKIQSAELQRVAGIARIFRSCWLKAVDIHSPKNFPLQHVVHIFEWWMLFLFAFTFIRFFFFCLSMSKFHLNKFTNFACLVRNTGISLIKPLSLRKWFGVEGLLSA